jgi:hypothetical protein
MLDEQGLHILNIGHSPIELGKRFHASVPLFSRRPARGI